MIVLGNNLIPFIINSVFIPFLSFSRKHSNESFQWTEESRISTHAFIHCRYWWT